MATERATSSTDLHNAGDINLEYVRVTSLANSTYFDIKNQVITLQIFEDMFSPFTTGSIIVRDALDLINNMPFAGMEYVDIKAYTPTLDVSLKDAGVIQGRFYIYKITEREYVAEKSVVYQLHLISEDAVADLNNKISKTFSGKISEIASQLVKDSPGLGSQKTLILEETKNNTKFISNYWSPAKCINYILQQATNINGSSTYCFFENRSGYNFISLDFLNDLEPRQKFTYGTTSDEVGKTGGSRRNIDRDYQKILEVSVPSGFDYIDRVRTGTYASRLIVHDMTSKQYKTINYDYLEKFNEGKETRLNKFPITTDTVIARVNAAVLRDEVANQLFNSFGDVSNYKTTQDRISRMKQAEAFRVNVKVKGRSDYTVGQKVDVTIFSPEPTKASDTPESTIDRMYSGNYLIAAINHVIDREKHECYMELIKDTVQFDLKTGKTS